MIVQKFKTGQKIMGQEALFLVRWADKNYFLMKDGDGVFYSTPVDDDGNPSFL